MTIEVQGPDGSSFQFPDGTPEATITSALQQHYGPPKTEAFDRNDPRFQDGTVKAALRGVPVVGPLVTDKASAAISAAANPVTGVGSSKPSFKERYAENLSQEEAARKAFETEHPVQDAIAGGVGGTIALGGFGGLVPAAARAMGMTGKLLPAMRNAALSGSAIGAADAAARGTDPATGAVAGGLTGPAGVLVGKGAGKAFDAVARPRGPATPQRFIDVNGEQVPVRESVVSRNPDVSMEEQAMLRGSRGTGAQGVAQGAEEATTAAMERARGRVASAMDPTGQSPAAAPLAAGEASAGDLVSLESQRAAAEVARTQAAANETAGLRAAMDVPRAPVAPHMPQDVGQMLSTRIGDMFRTARGVTRSAYERAGQVEGAFDPGRLVGSGEQIRLRLNSAPGNERVRISPEVTPNAQAALRTIDEEIAGLRFTNDAARGDRAITPADVEQVRKQLVILRRQANNAARTNGNWEDARAVGRVMEEFDDHIARVARSTRGGRPGFSGDVDEYLRLQAEARGAHARERATFSRRGPGDQVGGMMEGIIGKYPGQEMSPDKIVRQLLGSPDSPGGPEHAVAALGHLRETLGPNSTEWAAIKKLAISYFTEAGAGEAPVALEKQAERMLRFLGNQRHSGAIFDASERARLMAHANRLARVEDPAPLKGTVEQKIAVLSGRTTGEAATGEQVISALKRDPKLARAVMREVSPESATLIKQGLFEEVTAAPEGATAWGPQKIGEKLAKFLQTELAQAIYTPNERMMMRSLADAYHQIVPIPGTTNPSGTAHMASKLVTGLKNQMLGLFGFAHGGLPGAGIAIGLGKALEWGGERRAVAKATERFLGQQPRRADTEAVQRAAVTAAQVPALSNQSR